MTTYRVFLAVTMVVIGMWCPLASAAGTDLSECRANSTDTLTNIRCGLWTLAGLTRPVAGRPDRRTSGAVRIDLNRWAEVEIIYETLRSPWPDEIRLFLYQLLDGEKKPLMEIRDYGLDGLSPRENRDRFMRYEQKGRVPRIPLDPDAKSLMEVNRDYLRGIKDVLTALEAKSSPHTPVTWKKTAKGLELGKCRALRYIRRGSNELILLRVDPHRFDLVPFSHQESGVGEPATVENWAGRLPRAAAVFNSGQYYPDNKYIGMMLKDGRDLGTLRHPNWKALLLSGGPGDDPAHPPSEVLDLLFDSYDSSRTTYRYVVQSFMLLDHRGVGRVRESVRLASRTVLAQDGKGRLIVLFIPGACTLHELALLIKHSSLKIKKAMCLDGGLEAQLLVRDRPRDLAAYGGWVVNERTQIHTQWFKPLLPAVIAVMPRP